MSANASDRSSSNDEEDEKEHQAFLRTLFRRTDKGRKGYVDANDLQRSLSNGSSSLPFNSETIRILINTFDQDESGTLGFAEFCDLWEYMGEWKKTFERTDMDRSGDIDLEEMSTALKQFGYRLSDRAYEELIKKYDRTQTGHLHFDDFIQMCLALQTLTGSFRAKDKDQDGWIRISYEEFIRMALSSTL